jgi:hypothetical protein
VVPPETIPGPLQLNDAPAVEELALMVPFKTEQVKVNGDPGVTFGGVVLFVTFTFAAFVQPLAGSVTVTVYVPEAFTVGVEVLPPEAIPGPAHE